MRQKKLCCSSRGELGIIEIIPFLGEVMHPLKSIRYSYNYLATVQSITKGHATVETKGKAPAHQTLVVSV